MARTVCGFYIYRPILMKKIEETRVQRDTNKQRRRDKHIKAYKKSLLCD